MSSRKPKYIKKTVEFQGSKLVMYSLDGDTWSTRKEELEEIIERHELQKQNFGGQIKGGPQVKTIKPEPKEDKQGQEDSRKMRKVAPVVEAQKEAPEEEKKPAKKKEAAKKTKSKTKTKTKTKAKSKAKGKSKSKTKAKTKKTSASKKATPAPKKRTTGSAKKKSTKAKKKSAA